MKASILTIKLNQGTQDAAARSDDRLTVIAEVPAADDDRDDISSDGMKATLVS